MTPNEIIGSLIYRTNNALNGNAKFLQAIRQYEYYPALLHDDRLHLWHFPGTANEISDVFQELSKSTLFGAKLKFPAILNFQSVIQEHQKDFTVMRINLAIITPVLDEWTTQVREEQAYKLVLKPIEDEFIRQVQRFRHFQIPTGHYPYVSAYVPTTGKALNSVMKFMYGDFVDAIELPNFTIKVLKTCEDMSEIIESESIKVTEEIKKIVTR